MSGHGVHDVLPAHEDSPGRHRHVPGSTGRTWGRALAVVPLAVVAWWGVGHLAWLLSGANLPAGPDPRTAGGDNVTLLVPLVSSRLALLVTGSLVGGLCAGASAVLARARWRSAIGASFVGVALAVTVTLAQATYVLRNEAETMFVADDRVLAGFGGAVVAATCVGWLFGVLAVTGRPAAGVALAVLAGATPHWMSGVAFAVVDLSPESSLAVAQVGRWAAAVLLALALLVIGGRPWWRVPGWPVAVLLAWFVGPTLTASGYLEQLLRPAAGLPDALGSSLVAAWQVFTLASSPSSRPLSGWIVAILVAAVLTVALELRRSRSSTSEEE